MAIQVGSRVQMTMNGKLHTGTVISKSVDNSWNWRSDEYTYSHAGDFHCHYESSFKHIGDPLPSGSYQIGDTVDVLLGKEAFLRGTIVSEHNGIFTVALERNYKSYGWLPKNNEQIKKALALFGLNTESTYCWDISRNSTAKDYDHILRLVKRSGLPQPPEKTVDNGQFKKGERIVIEFKTSDGIVHEIPGTYIGSKFNGIIMPNVVQHAVYLDKAITSTQIDGTSTAQSSWAAHSRGYDLFDTVREMGLDTSSEQCWYVEERICSIRKENMAYVQYNKLTKGDRVLASFRDREGFNHEVEAIVVNYESNGNVLIYTDEDMTNISQSSCLTPNAHFGSDIVKTCREMGLDPAKARINQFAQGNTHIKILKVLSKQEGKDNKMETKKEQGFGAILKDNAEKAAWRTGATQMTNAVQAGILLMLKEKHGFDDGKLAIVKEMLTTSMGHAIIEFVLGTGLHFIPGINEDARVKRLAEELRIGGMSEGMNEVVGVGMTYLMPGIHAAIQALPPIEEALPEVVKPARRRRVASPKPRVAETSKTEAAIQEAAEAEAAASDNAKEHRA